MITLVDVLKRTTAFFEERGIPSPRMEAELLLGHALELDRVRIYMNHQRPLDETELKGIRELVARRARREPLHWILGSRGFHDIDLLVHPGVLVPRPDTEALVEAVLGAIATGPKAQEANQPSEPTRVVLDEPSTQAEPADLEPHFEPDSYQVLDPDQIDGDYHVEMIDERQLHAQTDPAQPAAAASEDRPAETPQDTDFQAPEDLPPIYIADVGCGTGAVGLALAHALPQARVYCTDIDAKALDNTRANVTALGLEGRVAVLEGPLLQPIPGRRPIDWVVSNPPYIATQVLDGLEPEVARWEPRAALDGGRDGLDLYRQLIPMAANRARVGVAVEIGFDQAQAVSRLFERARLQEIRVVKDLGGNDRVVLGWVSHQGAQR